MQILTSPSEFTGKKSVLALGTFDGVHIGHQKLIRTAVALSKEQGAQSVVCTFDRHPMEVLAPGRAPLPLTDIDARIARFAALGADCALVTPFTAAFSQISAEDYLRGLIRDMHACAIVVGENHHFGRKGQGDSFLLMRVANDEGILAVVLPPVLDQGEVVSSTLIRRLILRGETARARRLLGAG